MRFNRMSDTPKNRDDDRRKRDDEISPAGTHDKPHLTDEHKTPGTGVLPDKDDADVEGPTG